MPFFLSAIFVVPDFTKYALRIGVEYLLDFEQCKVQFYNHHLKRNKLCEGLKVDLAALKKKSPKTPSITERKQEKNKAERVALC